MSLVQTGGTYVVMAQVTRVEIASFYIRAATPSSLVLTMVCIAGRARQSKLDLCALYLLSNKEHVS